MAENANWKQVDDVLKTEGNILEIGSFIARSGNKVDITSEDADILFSNIDSRLPFVVYHEDGYQEEVGYATKFSRSNTGISHKGLVFTNDNVKTAVSMGYSISPEIDFVKDTSGKVVDGKIVRLAFVPNPAMRSTGVDITRFAFSAPEVTSMSNDGTSQNTVTPPATPEQTVDVQGQQIPVSTFNTPQAPAQPPAFDPNTFAQNIAASIAEGISAKIGGQLEAMQQEIVALKGGQTLVVQTPPVTPEGNVAPAEPPKVDSLNGIPKELFDQFAKLQSENQAYKAQLDRDEKVAYTNKLAELRSLQVDNPEKLVAHLGDYKSKIATLDAFKVTMMKNTPMNSPAGASPMSAEGGKKSNKTPTIMDLADSLRISIDTKDAEQLSKRMKLPIQ